MHMMRVIVWVSVLLVTAFPVAAAEPPTALSSASAVLYEPTTGRVLFEKDADTKRPMASTTKLMTALIAAERLNTESVVTVPTKAVLVEGSAMGLRGGDELTVRDLLVGLLLSSGNDAANALALLTSESLPAFSVLMNAKAAELGMERSVFVTPSGLDEGEHGATARELALLGSAVLKQPLLSEICATKHGTVHINGKAVSFKNHNRLLWLYEDAVGLKTGFTKKSGKCLVSAAERDGVTLVAATLNGGDYWNDHIALYEYGFSLVEYAALPIPELPEVPVCGGEVDRVSVALPSTPQAVLLRSEKELAETEFRLPAFLWAPIQQGDTVGEVLYHINGRVVATVPLVATEAVEPRKALTMMEKWSKYFSLLVDVVLR